jgi:hypothetical protein
MLDTTTAALEAGVHVLLIVAHHMEPRNTNDIHGAMIHEIGTEEYVLPRERPWTAVAYTGGAVLEAFVRHFAGGQSIQRMGLFLTRSTTSVSRWKLPNWSLGRMFRRSIKRSFSPQPEQLDE